MHLHVIQRETARRLNLSRFFTGKPCKRGNIAERRTSTSACLCHACKNHYRDQRAAAEALAPERLAAKVERDRKYRDANRDRIRQRKRRYYEANREQIISKALDYAQSNKVRVSARMKAYLQSRAGEIKAQKRERYLANRDEVLAKARAHYAANRAEVMGRLRCFYRENRHLFRSLGAKQRAAKRQRIPAWFGEFDEFVVAEAFALASARGSATGIEWQVDHMVPLLCRVASGLHCGRNLQVIPRLLNQSKHARMILTEPDEWLSAL